MLPKEFRLKKRKDFNFVHRAGKPIFCPAFSLIYVSVKIKGPKIGFSVSKKVGNAVVRNKVKRRMREAVRAHIKQIKPYYYIIFAAKPEIAGQDYAKIKQAVEFCLKKAALVETEAPQSSIKKINATPKLQKTDKQ